MITEDYCSFELSKLLKKKGFDEACRAYYDKDGNFNWVWNCGCSRNDEFSEVSSCPTHQMAMKWLRTVHNIIIAIRPPYNWNGEKPINYRFDVWHYCDDNTDNNISVVSSTTYEEAVEHAIKYSLENLI